MDRVRENREKTGKKRAKKALLCLLLAAILSFCGCTTAKTEQQPSAEPSPSKKSSSAGFFSEEEQGAPPSQSPADPSLGLEDPSLSPASPLPSSPLSDPADDTPYFKPEGEGAGTVAVWWWNKGHAAKANRKKYLDFLQKNGVNEIYICWPDFKSAHLADFVKAAGEKGMGVSLLSGDASWIDPQNDGADAVINAFLEYQKGAGEGERLLSLHMDVEPHQLSDFSTNRQKILQNYADFVVKTAEKVRNEGELIAWDIPFWFDEFTVKRGEEQLPLLDLLAQNADVLCLMSYRDSAQAVLECAQKELTVGKRYGCQVICGVETHSAEGDHVSFMEEGKAYMYQECAALYEALSKQSDEGKYGIAVHYLETWYKLKD